MRFRVFTILLALAAAAALLLAAPATATARDASPCASPTQIGFGQVQFCPLWMPKRGFIPVHRFKAGRAEMAARLVRAGAANWFICQDKTPDGMRPISYTDPGHPKLRNVWWAKTLADDGRTWGWVSEVYFSGGANNQPDARLARCDGGPATIAPVRKAPVRRRQPGTTQCQAVRENTGGESRFRYEVSRYTYDKGEVPAKEYGRRVWRPLIGKVDTRMITCRQGRMWRILSPISMKVRYPGLSSDGDITGDGLERGWITTVEGSSWKGGRSGLVLRVAVAKCDKTALFAVIGQVSGLPLPGLSYAVSVGQWVIQQIAAFSDAELNKAECSVHARYRIHYNPDRQGRVRPITERVNVPIPVKQEHVIYIGPGSRGIAEVYRRELTNS